MPENEIKSGLNIRTAKKEDVPLILEFVKGIAEFENLSHLVTATEESLKESMFGKTAYAEVFFAELEGIPAVLRSFSTIFLLL
jgi:hypothetical protein